MQLSFFIALAGLVCFSSAALTGTWRRSPRVNDTTAALILGESVSGTCFTVSDLAAFKTCDNDLTWEETLPLLEKRVNQLGQKAMKDINMKKKEVKAKKAKKCSRKQSLHFQVPVNATTSIAPFKSDTQTAYSLISFDVTGPFTIAELTTLTVSYEFLSGNCGGGSMRWTIATTIGDAWLYFGDYPSFTDCKGANSQSGVNMMTLTDRRWDLSPAGGIQYSNLTHALRFFGNANITNLQLVVDSSWFGPQNQSVAIGTVQINDQTLFNPAIGSCPFNASLPFNVTRLTTQPNCTKQAYPSAVKPSQGNLIQLELNPEWNPYYNPNAAVEEEEEETVHKGKGKGKTTTVADLWYPCFLNYDYPLANITSYGNYALNIFSADGLTVLETIQFSVIKPAKPTKKAMKNNKQKNNKGNKNMKQKFEA